MAQNLSQDQLKQVFQAFDRDGSGSVSAKEFTDILRQAGVSANEASDDQIAQIVQAFDQTGDAQLNFQEFQNLFQEVMKHVGC
jgi:Ca2+-binding EF-hand superfamily protein